MTAQNQESTVLDYTKGKDDVTKRGRRKKDLRLTVGGYGLRLKGLKIECFHAKRITISDPRALSRPYAGEGETEDQTAHFALAAASPEAMAEDATGAEGAQTGGLSLEGVEITGISIDQASLQHPPEPEEDPDDVSK